MIKRYFYYFIVGLIMCAGIGVRAHVYLMNRALWLDEAALANNLLLPHTILNNMQFGQAAPPLFKLISLVNLHLFGINEFALRLFPLVCGILAIFVFYYVCTKILASRLAKILALLLFCANNYLIYYSSEFKQYSSDVLVVLALIAVFLSVDLKKIGTKSMFLVGILYSLKIWLSHFSLFMFPVLAGYMLLKKSGLKRIIAFCAPFAVSFCAFYITHLQYVSHSEFMQNYWQFSFITSGSSLFYVVKNCVVSAFYPCKFILLILFLIFAGAIKLALREKANSMLILAPIAAVFIAACLSLYPFAPRLCLPLIPLAILLICASFDGISLKNTKTGWIFFAIFILAFWQYWSEYPTIILKKNIYLREEMRELLTIVKREKAPTDRIFIMQDGHQAFRFYNKKFGFDETQTDIAPYTRNFESRYTEPISEMTTSKSCYWVVFVQYFGKHPRIEDLSVWLAQNTRIIKVYTYYENYLFYVERK